MKLRNRTKIYSILLPLIAFGLLAGCGTKNDSVAQNTETEIVQETESVEEDPEIAAMLERSDAFRREYMGYDRQERENAQDSFYLLQEQEDAKDMEGLVHDPSLDDIWEGYNVVELGLLKPEQMPNCQTDSTGLHFVVYDGLPYIYVNDLPNKEQSVYAEYADVWCYANSPDEIHVLGDLEEYGKYRAKEGGNAE